MRLSVDGFKGEVPSLQHDLLAREYGTQVQGAKLTRGNLRGFRDFATVDIPPLSGGLRAIYRWGAQAGNDASGFWFAFNELTYVARGPVGGDTIERTYFADGARRASRPQITYAPIATQGGSAYPVNSKDLGVPAPSAKANVTTLSPSGEINTLGWSAAIGTVVGVIDTPHGLSDGQYVYIEGVSGLDEVNERIFLVRPNGDFGFVLFNPDTGAPINIEAAAEGDDGGGTWELDTTKVPEADKETRFYVYTYVSSLGEEGPPSSPSDSLDWAFGQSVELTGLLAGAASGNFDVAFKRVYRLATVGGRGAYQFLAELPLAATEFTDTVATADLGEVLETLVYDVPPEDLDNLVALPNGVLAGTSKNQLCLSIPGQPHAWPTLYRDTANYPLVALGNFGTTLVAATEDACYLANGSDPQAVTLEELPIHQGCVAQESMVNLPFFGVAYASPDGLVLVGPQGPQLVTAEYFDYEDWQALNPASMRAYVYDRRYYGFYDNGAPGGLIFDPAPGGTGLVFLDYHVEAGYYDPLIDKLHVVLDGEGVIKRFDAEGQGRLPYRWVKRFPDVEWPVNFPWAEVLAESYNDLTLKVYADGALVHTEAVASSEPFRLPSGFESRDWTVELAGIDPARRIMLAESVEELVI